MGLRDKVFSGAGWMIGARLVERLLGLASTLVLARVLVPADFGLVAMATSVYGLVATFSAFSFETALLRQQHASRADYDTVWTLEILLGAAIALLSLALAWPTAWMYRDDRVAPIMAVLALGTFIHGFGNVGVVAFRKELEFRREFLFLIGKKLAAVFTAVPLALVIGNYWALIWGMVAGQAATVLLSYLVHPYRPRPSLAAWRGYLSFSHWLLVSNVLEFVYTRYADFVVGRLFGAAPLGAYNVAADIATLPASTVGGPINRAAMPVFAKVGDDPVALRAEYLVVLGMTTGAVAPMVAGIAAVAPDFVAVLLGPKWSAAVPGIAVLVCAHGILAVRNTAYPVFYARGVPWIESALRGLLAAILLVALPLAGLQAGMTGVLVATLGASLVVAPATFAVTMRMLSIPIGALIAVLWRPLTASATMVAIVMALQGWLADAPALLRLVSASITGALAYGAVLAGLWWCAGSPAGVESHCVERARAILRARRARAA